MNRTTWDIAVKIPFYEIGPYLTDAEYEKASGVICEDVTINLSFDYYQSDRDVGIMSDGMEYNGTWTWNNKNYGKIIEYAIQKYLTSIDVDAIWGNEAYKSYMHYCNYLRNGI